LPDDNATEIPCLAHCHPNPHSSSDAAKGASSKQSAIPAAHLQS
jgi:hypothetical protein